MNNRSYYTLAQLAAVSCRHLCAHGRADIRVLRHGHREWSCNGVHGRHRAPGTIPGDTDNDDDVDADDAALLAANWLAGPGATWSMGDFNNDGYVNDIDVTLMAANWGAGSSASVPEPSVIVYLAATLLLFCRWGSAQRFSRGAKDWPGAVCSFLSGTEKRSF